MTAKTATSKTTGKKQAPATKNSATAKKAGGSARPEATDAEIARDRRSMLALLDKARKKAVPDGLPLLDADGIEEEVKRAQGGVEAIEFEPPFRMGSWTRNRTEEERLRDHAAMVADLERLRSQERDGDLPYLDLRGIRAEVKRRRGERT